MATATATPTPTLRLEAAIWRPAHTGTDYNDQPKDYPAQWIIRDIISGVRLAYGDEKSVEATLAKWAKRGIPEKIQDKMDSAEELKKYLKPGGIVKGLVRHVSSSGMSRRISLFCVADGDIKDITWDVANVLEESRKGRAGYVQDVGITVGGCGMDMVFHLVYNLSATLFPDGFGCVGRSIEPHFYCPANDHANGDRDYTPHSDSKPHWHADAGGYALRKESL